MRRTILSSLISVLSVLAFAQGLRAENAQSFTSGGNDQKVRGASGASRVVRQDSDTILIIGGLLDCNAGDPRPHCQSQWWSLPTVPESVQSPGDVAAIFDCHRTGTCSDDHQWWLVPELSDNNIATTAIFPNSFQISENNNDNGGNSGTPYNGWGTWFLV